MHLGCGRQKIPGAMGVDRVQDKSVDLVWNLDQVPWPLPTNTFSKIYMIDVLEHLNNIILAMEEVYRVSKNNAEIFIQSPFASSSGVWTDPTHRRGFTSRSFQYFTEEYCQKHFQYSNARFSVEKVEYQLWMPTWYDKLILKLANQFKPIYEKRFMYWFPIQNISFCLRVLK